MTPARTSSDSQPGSRRQRVGLGLSSVLRGRSHHPTRLPSRTNLKPLADRSELIQGARREIEEPSPYWLRVGCSRGRWPTRAGTP